MATGYRLQALSLFRRLLRASRQWKGDKEEARYIADEARKQFRAHQRDADPQAAARLLEEGENRLAIALHYGIAWPRLFHADQFEKVPYVEAPKLEAEPVEAVVSGIKDRDVAAKLAAAARRRRERGGQQERGPG